MEKMHRVNRTRCREAPPRHHLSFLVFSLIAASFVAAAGPSPALDAALAAHRAGDHARAQEQYAALALAGDPDAAVLRAISLLQEGGGGGGGGGSGGGGVSAAAPLLEAAARRGDYVAAQFLGASYGAVARRLAPAAAPPAAAARARWRESLEAAARWFRASLDGAAAAARRGEAPRPQAAFARPPADAYRGLGDALAWLGRGDEARAAFAEGAERGHLLSALCRPAERRATLDDERPRFLLPRAAFAHVLRPLEEEALPAAARELAAELAAEHAGAASAASAAAADAADGAVAAAAAAAPLFRAETGGLSLGRSWSQLPLLVDGRLQAAACARFPATCRALAALPEAAVRSGQAKLSRMARGTHVLPHAGPTNARVRVHCGLRVPPRGSNARMRVGDVNISWAAGECFAWSEGCEHEVWYDADAAAEGDGGRRGAGGGGEGSAGSGGGGGGGGGSGGGSGSDSGEDRIVLIVDVANPWLRSLDDYLAALADGGTGARARHEEVHARARREFEREERGEAEL
jgi:hypothetical protein